MYNFANIISILIFALFFLPASLLADSSKLTADQAARKLANPNTPLASLTFKLKYRSFKGDLPGADNQNDFVVLFQPSFPFPTANGNVIFFRPAFPMIVKQPVFTGDNTDYWANESGFGDIGFDLGYGHTSKKGILTSYGIAGSFPTGSSDPGMGETTAIGPEILIGKLSKTLIYGFFPNHQWDVGGSTSVSRTTLQFFSVWLPGKGYSYGTSPIITYDHIANNWAIPLNLQVGKTVILNGKPWKFGFSIDYYIKQPDAFGPKLMIQLSVAPVVKNIFASWFKH